MYSSRYTKKYPKILESPRFLMPRWSSKSRTLGPGVESCRDVQLCLSRREDAGSRSTRHGLPRAPRADRVGPPGAGHAAGRDDRRPTSRCEQDPRPIGVPPPPAGGLCGRGERGRRATASRRCTDDRRRRVGSVPHRRRARGSGGLLRGRQGACAEDVARPAT